MDVRGAGVAVVAVVVFVAMFMMTGVAQAVVVYGAAAVQVVLLVLLRGRRVPGFLAVWSVQAGLTYLWAGDGTAASALIYVLVGAVFAGVLTWVLRYAGTLDDAPAHPTDTRPLPVVGAEEE